MASKKKIYKQNSHLEKVQKVLLFLAKELNNLEIGWLLGASGALMVHGIDIVPYDLDIFTSKENLEILEKKFGKYIFHPMHIFKDKANRYLEFQAKIGEIEIEFCELDMKKVKPQFVFFKEINIPVNPLKEELEFYRLRPGKEEIVKEIKKII